MKLPDPDFGNNQAVIDASKQKKVELQKGLNQAEQLQKHLLAKWEYLSSDNKAHYNMKISTMKARMQSIRQQASKLLARLDDDANRAKLNIN